VMLSDGRFALVLGREVLKVNLSSGWSDSVDCRYP